MTRAATIEPENLDSGRRRLAVVVPVTFFVPMALPTSTGTEVQRPLAAIIVAGLITSTMPTFMVLRASFVWTHHEDEAPHSM